MADMHADGYSKAAFEQEMCQLTGTTCDRTLDRQVQGLWTNCVGENAVALINYNIDAWTKYK